MRLFITGGFTDIVILIPSILVKDFFFVVSHLFAIFDADKAFALVFDLGSVKETANAEEAGLFGHFTTSLKSLLILAIKA